jgi:hypothetical protein
MFYRKIPLCSTNTTAKTIIHATGASTRKSQNVFCLKLRIAAPR